MKVNLIEKPVDSNNSFFNSINYQKTIIETFNFKPFNLLTKNGHLPLFLIKQLTGNKLISIPFTTEEAKKEEPKADEPVEEKKEGEE